MLRSLRAISRADVVLLLHRCHRWRHRARRAHRRLYPGRDQERDRAGEQVGPGGKEHPHDGGLYERACARASSALCPMCRCCSSRRSPASAWTRILPLALRMDAERHVRLTTSADQRHDPRRHRQALAAHQVGQASCASTMAPRPSVDAAHLCLFRERRPSWCTLAIHAIWRTRFASATRSRARPFKLVLPRPRGKVGRDARQSGFTTKTQRHHGHNGINRISLVSLLW